MRSSTLNSSSDLVQTVYGRLRLLAAQYLERERRGHTLQPTALVHEAYMKLARQDRARFDNRHQFVRVAARAMQQILVNHERDRVRIKRGGGMPRMELSDAETPVVDSDVDLVALGDALDRLEQIDPRKVEVVQQRFFCGLTVEESAGVLGVSVAQVKRDWTLAKAWLKRELAAR